MRTGISRGSRQPKKPTIVELYTKAIHRYKRAVVELAVELKRGTPSEFTTIRELVTAIVVHATPGRPGGAGTKAVAEDDRTVRIDIKGRLAALCGNLPPTWLCWLSGPRDIGDRTCIKGAAPSVAAPRKLRKMQQKREGLLLDHSVPASQRGPLFNLGYAIQSAMPQLDRAVQPSAPDRVRTKCRQIPRIHKPA